MDSKIFWHEVDQLRDEFSLANHPIVTMIRDGKAGPITSSATPSSTMRSQSVTPDACSRRPTSP